jgi:NADH-quinone oxidoreductase subunit K
MSEIFKTVPVEHFVYLSAVLFVIGIVGVLTRRNAIIIFMSVELMLNSVNLMLVAFSSYHHDPAGQIFVFFIMAVAAAEVAVGLAIITMIYRNNHSVDIDEMSRMKG